MPLVSVVMPVYNGEKYLAEAIESILAQTFTDFEFIIVDDASCDGSAEIIRAYAQDDARIRFIQLADNVGEGGARNAGIAAARGEYIAGMDCDDVSLPERLREQVAYMAAHPDIAVLGAATKVVDECLNPISDLDVSERHALIVLNMFCGILGISHPTAMIRRDILAAAAGYNADLRLATDFELWLRLLWSQRARYANLAAPLLKYRRHESALGYQHSAMDFPNTTQVKLRALEKLWGEASEEVLRRFMTLRPWMKLSWKERRVLRRDLFRFVESMAAAEWVDPGDESLLFDEIDRRLEKTTPRRWQMFLHWRRHRFGR